MILFLGGLAPNTSPGDIKALLAPYADSVDVRIPLDRATKRQRGFAFVTIEDPRSAEAALAELDGKDWSGRVISVREAHTAANHRARSMQPSPYSDR